MSTAWMLPNLGDIVHHTAESCTQQQFINGYLCIFLLHLPVYLLPRPRFGSSPSSQSSPPQEALFGSLMAQRSSEAFGDLVQHWKIW